MKKFLFAAAAVISAPAFAQSATDSQDLTVTANVQQECSIGSQATTQNVWVSCNYAAKVSAASTNGGLLNAAGAALAANDPLDFTNLIEYRVKLTATDSSFPVLDFRTNGAGQSSVNAAGAFHNNAALEIRIDRDDTSRRPVAGTYTDVATLTVGPV